MFFLRLWLCTLLRGLSPIERSPALREILKINFILHGSELIVRNSRLYYYQDWIKWLGLTGTKAPCLQGELLNSITHWPSCLVYIGNQLRQGWARNPDASHWPGCGRCTLLPILNPHSGYLWMWVNLVAEYPCVFFNPFAMFVNAM